MFLLQFITLLSFLFMYACQILKPLQSYQSILCISNIPFVTPLAAISKSSKNSTIATIIKNAQTKSIGMAHYQISRTNTEQCMSTSYGAISQASPTKTISFKSLQAWIPVTISNTVNLLSIHLTFKPFLPKQ